MEVNSFAPNKGSIREGGNWHGGGTGEARPTKSQGHLKGERGKPATAVTVNNESQQGIFVTRSNFKAKGGRKFLSNGRGGGDGRQKNG